MVVIIKDELLFFNAFKDFELWLHIFTERYIKTYVIRYIEMYVGGETFEMNIKTPSALELKNLIVYDDLEKYSVINLEGFLRFRFEKINRYAIKIGNQYIRSQNNLFSESICDKKVKDSYDNPETVLNVFFYSSKDIYISVIKNKVSVGANRKIFNKEVYVKKFLLDIISNYKPSKLVLHSIKNFNDNIFIKALIKMFDNNIEFCFGCTRCKYGSLWVED